MTGPRGKRPVNAMTTYFGFSAGAPGRTVGCRSAGRAIGCRSAGLPWPPRLRAAPAPPRRRTTGVALLASLAAFVIAAAVAVPLIVLKMGGSFALPSTPRDSRMAGTTTTSSLSGLQSSMSRDAHVEVAAYGTTVSGPMVLSVVATDTPGIRPPRSTT